MTASCGTCSQRLCCATAKLVGYDRLVVEVSRRGNPRASREAGPMRLIFLAFAALIICISSAAAADYPAKAITIIVPFAPGGSNDIVARAIGQKLTEDWGQPVIVDNRAGAGGVIGAEFVARAA